MGMDQSIYLGPYLVCRDRPRTVVLTMRKCGRNGCSLKDRVRPDGIFCSGCGGRILDHQETAPDSLSWYDVDPTELLHELDTREAEGGERIFGPNHGGPPKRKQIEEREDNGIELLGFNMQAEVAWFEKKYAKAITIARANFDDVRVTWGLRVYFS